MAKFKLVLANGAFKSGSTWLRDIVANLEEFDPIPRKYARQRLPHWVNISKIDELLRDQDAAGPFLSKSHVYRPSIVRGLLKNQAVGILNITRDIRDVIVSHYYHYKRARRSDLDFSEYYWTVGRFKAREVVLYNKSWAVKSNNVFSTTFENLKEDFPSQVRDIAAFLDRSVKASTINEIAEKTSLESLRKKRNEENKPEAKRFFRKGIVGDWKNHFSESELIDLEIVVDTGFAKLSEKMQFAAAFRFRRLIRQYLNK